MTLSFEDIDKTVGKTGSWELSKDKATKITSAKALDDIPNARIELDFLVHDAWNSCNSIDGCFDKQKGADDGIVFRSKIHCKHAPDAQLAFWQARFGGNSNDCVIMIVDDEPILIACFIDNYYEGSALDKDPKNFVKQFRKLAYGDDDNDDDDNDDVDDDDDGDDDEEEEDDDDDGDGDGDGQGGRLGDEDGENGAYDDGDSDYEEGDDDGHDHDHDHDQDHGDHDDDEDQDDGDFDEEDDDEDAGGDDDDDDAHASASKKRKVS